jgi:hypothetical protein
VATTRTGAKEVSTDMGATTIVGRDATKLAAWDACTPIRPVGSACPVCSFYPFARNHLLSLFISTRLTNLDVLTQGVPTLV